jgi:hypothetical protein
LGRTDFERFERPSLQIEVSQIIIHKADQPDVVLHPLDAEAKTVLKLIFFETDAAAMRNDNGFVVEGIVDVRQSGVGTRAGMVDLGRDIECPELRADAR